MTDLRSALGAQRLAGEVARHRHRWVKTDWAEWEECASCRALRDPAKSRKGRSSRNRGNRRELEIAKSLGGVKVGHHGGPEDVRAGMLNVQSKVRKAFPNWQWDELAKLPRTGGRLPALIVTDSPGSGIKRRCIVVMCLDDFVELHGEP
jgi:hypothetical protein